MVIKENDTRKACKMRLLKSVSLTAKSPISTLYWIFFIHFKSMIMYANLSPIKNAIFVRLNCNTKSCSLLYSSSHQYKWWKQTMVFANVVELDFRFLFLASEKFVWLNSNIFFRHAYKISIGRTHTEIAIHSSFYLEFSISRLLLLFYIICTRTMNMWNS